MSSGFPIQRDPSTQVFGAGDWANQSAANQSVFAAQAAALPTPQNPTQYASSLMQPVVQNYLDMYNNAGFNLGPNIGSIVQGAVSNDFNTGNLGQAAAAVGGQDNWNAWNAYSNGGYQNAQGNYQNQLDGINQAAFAQGAAERRAADAREANRVTQQNGYSNLLGGGATGGLLTNWNGLSGGSPSSTVQPGSVNPTSASAWGNTGLMGANGFGGGGNAPTTTPQTWSATGQATQPQASNLGMGSSSWGGPFSNKNPWSLG